MSYAEPSWQDARFASGAAVSEPVALGARPPVALRIPDGFSGAAITLQESRDGVTWRDVYDAQGNEVSIPVAPGRFVLLSAPSFLGFENLRLRSGTAAAPVTQGAERVVQITTRGFA